MSTAETLSAEALPAQTLPLEEARLVESRTYPAPAGEWNVDESIYAAAEADPIAFWEDGASSGPSPGTPPWNGSRPSPIPPPAS